jgi:hypothetical protein
MDQMHNPPTYELVPWNSQVEMPAEHWFNCLDRNQPLEVTEDGDLAGVFANVRYRISPLCPHLPLTVVHFV